MSSTVLSWLSRVLIRRGVLNNIEVRLNVGRGGGGFVESQKIFVRIDSFRWSREIMAKVFKNLL